MYFHFPFLSFIVVSSYRHADADADADADRMALPIHVTSMLACFGLSFRLGGILALA